MRRTYARKIYIKTICKGNYFILWTDLEGSRRKRPHLKLVTAVSHGPQHAGLVWGQLRDAERGRAVWRASSRMSCDCEPGHAVNLQRSHRERVKRIKSDFYHFPSPISCCCTPSQMHASSRGQGSLLMRSVQVSICEPQPGEKGGVCRTGAVVGGKRTAHDLKGTSKRHQVEFY